MLHFIPPPQEKKKKKPQGEREAYEGEDDVSQRNTILCAMKVAVHCKQTVKQCVHVIGCVCVSIFHLLRQYVMMM